MEAGLHMVRGGHARLHALLVARKEREHAPIQHLLMVGKTVWAAQLTHKLAMKGRVQVK